MSRIEYKRMKLKNNPSSVFRKGAWAAEEDMLLKKCIEKFGEGKWHLVPLRAGLNRCRKSCRLRWLNYLRPNIKRGEFDEDEVDLMLRLHKLLGNRWSLIAGRIPGRTANDVKNYWNTHVRYRSKQHKDKFRDDEPSQQAIVTIIKPQPRTISKTLSFNPQITTHLNHNLITSSNDGVDHNASSISPLLWASSTLSSDKINEYLGKLFDEREKEIDDQVKWSIGGFSEGVGIDIVEQDDGQNSLFDFSIDDVLPYDILDSSHL